MTQQQKSERAKGSRPRTSTRSANVPLDSRPSSETLPPVLQLRDYQQRWIDDPARFKAAVKSARIGYSFATAIEAVLDCLANPNTSWTVLCPAKHQAKEFIETASDCVKAMASVAEAYQETIRRRAG
jgi:phage FluMu gp28-like protein